MRNMEEYPSIENDEEIEKIDKIMNENDYWIIDNNDNDNEDNNIIYNPFTIEIMEEERMILQPNYIFECKIYESMNMIEENEMFYNYGFSDNDDGSDSDTDNNYKEEGEEGEEERISSICFSDSSVRSTTSSLNSHVQTKLRRKKPINRNNNNNNNNLLMSIDKNKLPPKPQTPTTYQLQQQQQLNNYNNNNDSMNNNRRSSSRVSNRSRNGSIYENINSPRSNRNLLKKSLNDLSTTSVFSLSSVDNITHEVEDGFINKTVLNSKCLGIHISIQLYDNNKMCNKLDVTQYNESNKKIVEITRDLLLNKKKSINDQLQTISKTNYVKNNNNINVDRTANTIINHSIPIIISIENVIDKSIIPSIYNPQFVNFGVTGYLGWYYTRHSLTLLQNNNNNNNNNTSLVIKFLPQQTLITGLKIENKIINTICPSHSLQYNSYRIIDCIRDYYNRNILMNNNNNNNNNNNGSGNNSNNISNSNSYNNLNILVSPLSPLSPLNISPSVGGGVGIGSNNNNNIIPPANIMNWSRSKCIEEWKKCTDVNNFYFNCPKGSESRNGNYVMSKITLHHSILYEIHKSLMNEIHDYCKENNIIKPKYIILLDHQEYHIPSEFIFLDFADSEVHVSSNSRWCGVGSGIISSNQFLQSFKIQSYM